MRKSKTSILTLMIFTLFTGCSNSDTDTSYPEFPSRWTSNNGSKYHVWFQDWSDYTRMFLKINSDTVLVEPNKYAAVAKGKNYLFPKEYKQISYKQLIGNIDWKGLPKWDKGSTNSFKWLVDRSNPKIKLPQAYLCEATMSNDNNLNLKILNGSEILYELDLKPAKVY